VKDAASPLPVDAGVSTVASMPRPSRLQLAGGVYHVNARAAQGGMLFPGALQRDVFEDVLMIAFARAGWICHAYCLLGTHYHFVIETPEANLGVGMKRLNWLYAWRFNRMFGMNGHVFASRYWSCLIETDEHALSVIRYLALNPVKAGLCTSPLAWPWSSYAATVGVRDCPEFLSTDWALRLFGDRRELARKAMRRFVEVEELAPAA
jgi:putative transposase